MTGGPGGVHVRVMRTLSGKSRLAGILGWPVSHSRSPRLHGFWLARHGVDGAYVPLPVRPEGFAAAVRGLVELGFAGANVTIPHKEAAFALCDEVSEVARRAGSVNTLVFRGGRIHGTSTDGFGFLESVREQAPGWRATGWTGPMCRCWCGPSASMWRCGGWWTSASPART